MSMVRIKRLRENAVLPTHGSAYAAGYDLCACLDGGIGKSAVLRFGEELCRFLQISCAGVIAESFPEF